MIEVDARGLSCPEPLMLVDKAWKAHPGETLRVLVSEVFVKTNVEKFAKSKGKKSTAAPTDDGFALTIE
ncbi:MAG: sulfurtransferase TusA family protein [Lachnospiraceae bacterium]|jgi:TusA-related sulfurtransferase|nr:sulfurtransferase TusA family protein [Lachnospiraceae bacterium]